MLNPFDLKSALLAKHAQHVVLIHFPIALYLAGTFFDLCARIFRKASLGEVARWNFRSEEHTSELQSHSDIVCRLLLEKKKYKVELSLTLYISNSRTDGPRQPFNNR